jgi:hypothetical protein
MSFEGHRRSSSDWGGELGDGAACLLGLTARSGALGARTTAGEILFENVGSADRRLKKVPTLSHGQPSS